jgi:hypothetical protein
MVLPPGERNLLCRGDGEQTPMCGLATQDPGSPWPFLCLNGANAAGSPNEIEGCPTGRRARRYAARGSGDLRPTSRRTCRCRCPFQRRQRSPYRQDDERRAAWASASQARSFAFRQCPRYEGCWLSSVSAVGLTIILRTGRVHAVELAPLAAAPHLRGPRGRVPRPLRKLLRFSRQQRGRRRLGKNGHIYASGPDQVGDHFASRAYRRVRVHCGGYAAGR